MKSTEKEKRILGAQEILFYAMNEASPKHFLIAAEIEDNTDEVAWNSAVAKLQKMHPMLGTLKVNYIAGPFIISGFNHTQAIGAATYNGSLVLTNSSRYLIPGLLKAVENRIKQAINEHK